MPTFESPGSNALAFGINGVGPIGGVTRGRAATRLKSYLSSWWCGLAEVTLEAAVGVAEEYGMYAYDAYMLECARRYHTPFLSLDRPQCAVAKRLGVEVI